VRLRAAVARNGAHHTAHARAFNQALLQAGAARQLAPDPRYLATVRRRLASIEDPASLADLLTELESVNAQTCTRFAILAQDRELRSLLVDVASVEAQHSSELLVLRTLLDSGHAGPGPAEAAVRAVPATVGTAGIPYTVYPTAGASAINEGTVR
jgi:tRNA isopentenyl-2-thiomethyl-A-37 hydroxylase MiaE